MYCCCHGKNPLVAGDSSEESSDGELSDDSAVVTDDDFWNSHEDRDWDSFMMAPALLRQAAPNTSNPLEAGTPGMPRRKRDCRAHCWDALNCEGVPVRGPRYFQDAVKVPSKSAMLVRDLANGD
eukprot:TRINITY_DN120047_c0_g1_i1.p1 TRINITY_DN120047_c0_g1~~TRINITY_DN120047_c0_g1_i1.p1  ORF type:complete len:135 (-),score=25.75 TRINITY_DN120047_c0_g1_i1:13-384(-)